MTVLPHFSTPANLSDRQAARWSTHVGGVFASVAGPGFPQFYDPTSEDTPADAQVVPVAWVAFPASLSGTRSERLEKADASRELQDEYCEWGVERNSAGKITRVTFTSEVPEYWEHLFDADRDALVELYRTLIDPAVAPDRLERNGKYLRANDWNRSTHGRPAHLIQDSNKLSAAIALAARATILREENGRRVTQPEELVRCGALGNQHRNSDPLIASRVNEAAAAGAAITLHDPVGLYIDGLTTGGMATPDGADPASYWTIERGGPANALRTVYEVPDDRGYVVGDVTIGGRKIEFGGQLAERVRVRLEAVVKDPGSHSPTPRPCEPPG